jgi:trehalose utilization protein
MQDEVTIKVTIWNEGRHEKLHPNVGAIYPSGIHGAIAAGLKNEGFAIRCGSLDDPHEGLGEQLLDDTDVLLWWGHIDHEEVSDALVDRIQQRVAAFSSLDLDTKPFRSTTTPMSIASLPTLFDGQSSPTPMGAS